ncbi:hypothetical protein N0V88_005015 [Collariella sp. IMI 366227]|nr:hypothetical protein N0V88_005015 [Collariella sp. IMI 366227]
MNSILTGAAMGAALTTAGVYAPDIILSQFTFTDFTMLQTFLTAAAGSTWEGNGKVNGAGEEKKSAETVYEALGVSRGTMFVGMEAFLVLAIAAAVKFTAAPAAEARGIPPYFAGLAIAAAQMVSILLRGSLLGASTAFEDMGGFLFGVKKYANVLFSAGVVAGAWLISSLVPALRPVTEVAVSPARAALGGFMIVFGSRMAGGCTSGHGISGLSLMSISSFLTAAATFGFGGLAGLLMA